MATAKREHWEQHLCCMGVRDVEGEHPSEDMTGSVYTAKNESGQAFVLMNVSAPGFDCNTKMLPNTVRRLAEALLKAADRAEEVQREFDSLTQVAA